MEPVHFLWRKGRCADKIDIIAVPATWEGIYFEIYGIDQFGAKIADEMPVKDEE